MTESVVDIIKRISPDFPVGDLLRECGGRRWWIPPVNDRPDYQAIREAIRADPCRDWRVIMRRYGVSRGFVYGAWNNRAAQIFHGHPVTVDELDQTLGIAGVIGSTPRVPEAQPHGPPASIRVPVDIAATYSQSAGAIRKPDGSLVALGWAGCGTGKNAPTMQSVRAVGPLPQGLYVVGVWCDHPRLGKMVAPLTQIEGETFGRDAFFIHGPSRQPGRYGQESMGCIVVPFTGRVKVKAACPDGSYLRVTA